MALATFGCCMRLTYSSLSTSAAATEGSNCAAIDFQRVGDVTDQNLVPFE